MKTWTLKQLIDGGFKPTGFTHFEPGQQTAIPFISPDVLRNALRRFGERVYAPLYEDGDTLEQALSDINIAWDEFHALHDDTAWRLYQAFAAEYKPLENYAMTETSTDSRTTGATTSTEKTGETSDTLTRTGTVTNATENSDTSERTDNLTDTTTRTGTVQTVGKDTGKTADTRTVNTTNTGTQTSEITDSTTNSVAAYDVEAFSNRDKQSKHGSDTRTDNLTAQTTNGGEVNTSADTTSTVTNNLTDTEKNTGTQTTTNSGTATNTQTNNTTDTTTISNSETISGTTNGTDNTEHTLTRSGNIGVTTSQQMLTSEVYLRTRNNLVYYIVELFVSQYTTW